MVVEGQSGDPASVEDAAAWRDAYGLTFEVLADSEQAWVQSWGDPAGGGYSQHSYTVVNSDGTVSWRKTGSATVQDIAAAVGAAD